MEMIRSSKQKSWGWPAVANFALGGMATSFYLLSSLLFLLSDGATISQRATFKLVAPVLTGLGLLALVVEAGHPWRGRYLLKHLRHSWMSRESLAAAFFIPAALLDWLWPHTALWALAAVAALFFVISQAFIMYASRGVITWNVSAILPLFLAVSFATGSGLILLTGWGTPGTATSTPAVAGLICATASLITWLTYLYGAHAPAFHTATRSLRRTGSLVVSVGLGHLLPISCLVLALASQPADDVNLWTFLAGGGLIVGGLRQKAGIILDAGYLRAVVLGPREQVRRTKGTPIER